MQDMIRVLNLKKSYGANEVLHGITFMVMQGEVFALLGVNGAGKTTTLECIEGLRRYESGKIEIKGSMGVQLQSSALMPDIKVSEAMELFAKWNKADYKSAVESLGLEELMCMKYKALSTGQKRRLHLALSLIGDPDILFLDEPTAGLDVEGRQQLHTHIRQLREAGKTIVLASHDMAEVEDLCDRIAILREGQIAFVGSPQELKSEVEQYSTVGIKASEDISGEPFAACSYLRTEQGYQMFSAHKLADGVLELLTYTKSKSIEVQDILTKHASLEQRFLEVSKEGA